MARDDQELFLVRIWAEPREIPGELSVYRGSVEHVRRGRHRYFADLQRLPELLRTCLDEDGALPPGGFADDLDA